MLIFLAIAVAAFIVVAGAFLFGHDHDIGHDHDMGHEVAGEADGTISVFSTRVLFTFLMGFGAVGAIGSHYGLNYMVSSLCGVGGGLVLAIAMYGVLLLFVKQQSTSIVSASSFIGCEGVVTVTIDRDRTGEVGLSIDGQYRTCVARGRNQAAIPKGHTVKVVAVSGDNLIVEAVQD